MDLAALNVDPRITIKPAACALNDGAREYLAIDGCGLFHAFIAPIGCKSAQLYATIEGDSIVFKGGVFGEHSLAANKNITSAERVIAHWRGYCDATDSKLGKQVRS